MKRVIIIMACATLCLLPAAGWAGIDGTDHDRGGQICKHCHIPHNANGDKLWATTPSGDFAGSVADLCYTCHDGTVTSVGDSTAFNTTRQNHKGIAANGSPGDCDGCHDVHNQNPDLSGKFLYTDIAAADGQYCTGCHGATPANVGYQNAHGDHRYGITGTTNHYTSGATFNCQQCHTPHGAVAQTFGSLTNPILLDTMIVGGVYGDFCIDCHNGTAPSWPPTGWVTNIAAGGVAASDVNNYSQATLDGTETSHPTTAGTLGGCDGCHDTHSADNDGFSKLLVEDNTDGAFCESCHSTGNAFSAPTIGTSHPANVDITAFATYNDTLTAGGLTLPWALEINDDPGQSLGTIDYPNATDNFITCETCHSVHRQGVYGPLLRETNAANELCGLCHPANY